MAISGNSKHFLFKKKTNRSPRLGGGPLNFGSPELLFFSESKPHAKFHNPRTIPSGRKVIQVTQEKIQKVMGSEKKTRL